MKFPLFFSCKHENSADNGCSLPYFNKCIILEHNALFSCYLISGIRTDLKSKYFTLGFPPLCDRWDPLGPPQIPGLLDFVVPMCIASRSTKTICYCFLYTPLGAIFYPSCVLWQTIVKEIYVGSLIFAYLSTTCLLYHESLGAKPKPICQTIMNWIIKSNVNFYQKIPKLKNTQVQCFSLNGGMHTDLNWRLKID